MKLVPSTSASSAGDSAGRNVGGRTLDKNDSECRTLAACHEPSAPALRVARCKSVAVGPRTFRSRRSVNAALWAGKPANYIDASSFPGLVH
jgi:hypothetical protein